MPTSVSSNPSQARFLAAVSRSVVYGITDSQLMPGELLFTKAEQALKAGIGCLQYREKNANTDTKRQRALRLLELCRAYNTPLIINDDLQLALEINADGVHLGQSDGSLLDARAQLGVDKILGATCHASLAMAQEAEAAGADYLAFGRFFTSKTKPDAPPAPLELIAQAKQQLSRPIVVIGGIERSNAPLVLEQGADMIAVVNSLFGDTDPATAARQLSALR